MDGTLDIIELETTIYNGKIVFNPYFYSSGEVRFVNNYFPPKNFSLTEGLWKCEELTKEVCLFKSRDCRTKINIQVKPIELLFTYELDIESSSPILLIMSGNKIYLELEVTGKSLLFRYNNKIMRGEVYTYEGFVVYTDNMSEYKVEQKYFDMINIEKLPELPKAVPAKDIYNYVTNLKNNENSKE